jgi:hypothetical protein
MRGQPWTLLVLLGAFAVAAHAHGPHHGAAPFVLPDGYWESRLTSPAEIGPDVAVTLLRGEVPGLYLDNRGEQTVTVYGAAGEPFLRIGPHGVEANVTSPSWLASGRSEAGGADAADAAAEPQWQLRSTAPRFSWLEPRARAGQWDIALRHGEQALRISGTTRWIAR